MSSHLPSPFTPPPPAQGAAQERSVGLPGSCSNQFHGEGVCVCWSQLDLQKVPQMWRSGSCSHLFYLYNVTAGRALRHSPHHAGARRAPPLTAEPGEKCPVHPLRPRLFPPVASDLGFSVGTGSSRTESEMNRRTEASVNLTPTTSVGACVTAQTRRAFSNTPSEGPCPHPNSAPGAKPRPETQGVTAGHSTKLAGAGGGGGGSPCWGTALSATWLSSQLAARGQWEPCRCPSHPTSIQWDQPHMAGRPGWLRGGGRRPIPKSQTLLPSSVFAMLIQASDPRCTTSGPYRPDRSRPREAEAEGSFPFLLFHCASVSKGIKARWEEAGKPTSIPEEVSPRPGGFGLQTNPASSSVTWDRALRYCQLRAARSMTNDRHFLPLSPGRGSGSRVAPVCVTPRPVQAAGREPFWPLPRTRRAVIRATRGREVTQQRRAKAAQEGETESGVRAAGRAGRRVIREPSSHPHPSEPSANPQNDCQTQPCARLRLLPRGGPWCHSFEPHQPPN
ncbi:hypothetical protein Cadr_000029562 [Camelus dromedarius]|uniref:Uncharacterized protein n=1 Tax=Camelus dromedarius TaxID=9838 RepID=A0A5N4CAK3_CAMDR|nr:hypothetical protein Cadr_000029562 [Camelus dromedarius]